MFILQDALDLPLILHVSPDESKITVYWKATTGLNGRPLPTYLLQVKRNNYEQNQNDWRNCTTLSTFCKVVVPYHSSYSIRLSIYGYSPFTECKYYSYYVCVLTVFAVSWNIFNSSIALWLLGLSLYRGVKRTLSQIAMVIYAIELFSRLFFCHLPNYKHNYNNLL